MASNAARRGSALNPRLRAPAVLARDDAAAPRSDRQRTCRTRPTRRHRRRLHGRRRRAPAGKQGASTVVLEASTLGWGASTRNGGIAHPGFKWGPATLVKRYGPEVRRARCTRESVEATDFLGADRRDEAIDAELRVNGYLELAWARGHAEDFPRGGGGAGRGSGSPRAPIPRERLARRSDERLPRRPGVRCRRSAASREVVRGLSPASRSGTARICTRASAPARSGGRPMAGSSSRRSAARSWRATSWSRRTATPTARRRAPAPDHPDRELHHRHRAAARGPRPRAVPDGPGVLRHQNFLSYWHVSADRRMIFGGRVSFLPTSVDRTARLLHQRLLEVTHSSPATGSSTRGAARSA